MRALWLFFTLLASTLALEAQSRDVGAASALEGYTYPSFEQRGRLATKHLQPNSASTAAWIPKSRNALLWALLPGGGQIYNRKYWKLPLVWGAIASSFYAVQWNQHMYDDYHAAYRDLSSSDPATNTAWLSFAPPGTKPEDHAQYSHLKSTLKRGNDFYRRYRDISIVATVLVYGLSILDAYVDAELATFDISPNLSLRVHPSLTLPSPGIPSYQVGLGCSLSF